MPNKIWIDVEDLFQYAAFNPRPSGIQRIEYELCRALASLPESRDRVQFVRHAPAGNSFYTIPYAELDLLYGGLTGPEQAGKAPPPSRWSNRPAPVKPLSGNPLRRLAYALPVSLRNPLVALWKAERDVGRALGLIAGVAAAAAGTGMKRTIAWQRGPASKPVVPGLVPFESGCLPGDILMVLGSPWFQPFYAELVGKVQRERGMRFALLVYDIIPLRRPEWCDQNLVQRFSEWTGSVFPLVDIFLTISQASARDIEVQAHESGYPLRSTPRTIPIGSGFTPPAAAPAKAPATGSSRQPIPGSYVLIVSTIEARKNHILLFRVWRRLLETLPRDQVPTLVFAGRVGWLVSDLMQQLQNADFLDGRIMLVEDPSDDDLKQLYAGCRFTVFPSFYEGWGLPVTESLSFGRPCIISNATALPEAGGSHARYFDPENTLEAYDVIRHAIENRQETEAWAEQVQRTFKPVTWEESAHGVLQAVDAPMSAPPGDAAD